MPGDVFDDEAFESHVGAEESFDGSELGLHGPRGGSSHGSHAQRFGGAAPRTTVITMAEPEPSDSAATTTTAKSASGAKIRTRPLPAHWRTKWPDAQSVLITNRDGRQVLFVA